MGINEISVIIPAYQPDEKLIHTVRELVGAGFLDVIVIDDGSAKECAAVFEQIKEIKECTLLVHPVNKGKGAALKTAFDYVIHNREEISCVVTADADGQHLTKDIISVSLAALESRALVLGVRDFSDPIVPARSKMGNRITSGVFRLFFGMKIGDTQTGLRAFPVEYLPTILKASGDRYEYETNMLFVVNRYNIPLEQVQISTVYLDDNSSSHFRVVRDSIRVYALILKYLLSSVSAAGIDALAFYIFKKLAFLSFLAIPTTYVAAIAARIISSLFNFWLNAKVVFEEKANIKSMVKYYILAAVQIILSATLVFLAENLLKITAPSLSTLVKVIIDTVLFFFSFRIQHKWVFNNKEKNGEDNN